MVTLTQRLRLKEKHLQVTVHHNININLLSTMCEIINRISFLCSFVSA